MRLLGPPALAARAKLGGLPPPQLHTLTKKNPATSEGRSTACFYDIQAGAPTISLSLRWILCFFE